MIAGAMGGQAGWQSEAGIFQCGGPGGERREGGRERELQRIWTIEEENGKISNKPPNYRLNCGHWSSV
jgi:hypothetical protein